MLVALLLAAGRSERASEDKALADLGGMPLFLWAAARLAADDRVGAIVIAARADALGETERAARRVPKIKAVVAGGATRADSARAALAATGEAAAVLVHDAARPFVDSDTIGRVIDALDSHGAAAAAFPVADTLRRGEDWAGETIDRTGVQAMQTPQAFDRAALLAAYGAHPQATDCAEAFLRSGGRVRLVRGHPLNFKVTTAEDLAYARALVAAGLIRPPLAGDT